ncbi:MAG: VOC family protein [Armatimonadetes bacterium]|nr:VOC family protein [Armatimonadota bacterium]
MNIDRIDHLVLTVADVEATIEFYRRVLGMTPVTFGDGRRALAFGQQKINLHPADAPFAPHAKKPLPGSADLCLIVGIPMDEVLARLGAESVEVIEGPVARTGALGPIQSVYFFDPDGNLLELSSYA